MQKQACLPAHRHDGQINQQAGHQAWQNQQTQQRHRKQIGERSEQANLASVAVKEVMEEPAVTISPAASVKEAAAVMVRYRIGCLPVVENDRLKGIVTETDILRQVAER